MHVYYSKRELMIDLLSYQETTYSVALETKVIPITPVYGSDYQV